MRTVTDFLVYDSEEGTYSVNPTIYKRRVQHTRSRACNRPKCVEIPRSGLVVRVVLDESFKRRTKEGIVYVERNRTIVDESHRFIVW